MSEVCAYFYRCAPADELAMMAEGLGFTDAASCSDVMGAEVCAPAEVDDPIRECRQTFDSPQHDLCLATLMSFPYMSLADFVVHPTLDAACFSTTHGTVVSGHHCQVSADCAAEDGYCNAGTCESRSGEQYEILCDGTVAGASACPGGACVAFTNNTQGIAGVCSRACQEDDACGLGSICADTDAGSYCLSTCLTDADCSNGLVCVIREGGAVGTCGVNAQ